MEVIKPMNCGNAPKQMMLLNYVIEQMTEEKMDTIEVMYILSHGKLSSLYGNAKKDERQYRFSYFAEFENHKKDSAIKHVEKIIEVQ
ncbi:hypothetical protein TP70_07085 [Staphylococcus microti]|uniref:Putative DNA-binding protein n=1 Tax=Staphylococcus microti TaxID=569857 RepID=A0A0D6XRK2_9STAP|nr:hypothetical protein [Staphylococcus microti]KIX90453.1 hypothetical protein TP70_07085 [Staphylococcus microti]PNZ80700.1 hypothetical protein CD132_07645 [Staphylococcus microti]SUM57907.1 putative DNA-binding protein [Staphylococcus microti]